MSDAIDWVHYAEDEPDPFIREQYLHRARQALPALDNPSLHGALERRIAAMENALPPVFVGPRPSPNRVPQ